MEALVRTSLCKLIRQRAAYFTLPIFVLVILVRGAILA